MTASQKLSRSIQIHKCPMDVDRIAGHEEKSLLSFWLEMLATVVLFFSVFLAMISYKTKETILSFFLSEFFLRIRLISEELWDETE